MSQFYDQASLVMIPSGYKDGKVYSQKPLSTDGELTFSRGSDIEATRVNANGFIEKAKVNLLLQSNSFSNASWSSGNLTLTSGQSGYDGTNNAWEIEVAVTGNYRSLTQASNTSELVTNSIYAKAGNSNYLGIVDTAGQGSSICIFDLTDGSVSYQLGGDFIEASSQSVGGGWYRLKTTHKGLSPNYMLWFVANASNSTGGTAGNSVFIQDAQQNYGLVAQEYQETTTTSVVTGITNDMPRLDYSGGASCPSLLLEPSRTNSLPHSEYFGAWNSLSSVSLSHNAAISPEGVTNATEITWGASGSRVQYDFTHSATSATYSVFVKSNGGSTFNILLRNTTTSTNIAEEIFTGATFQPTLDTNLPTSVDYSNGWYRVSITATSGITSGDTLRTYIYADDGGALMIYGAQCETGSYVTSIIPTYGTSASRAEDVCTKTQTFSEIKHNDVTLFYDFDHLGDLSAGQNQFVAYFGSGKYLNLAQYDANNYYVDTDINGSYFFAVAFAATEGRKKVAIKIDGLSWKVFFNGSKIIDTTLTQQSTNAMTEIILSGGTTSRPSFQSVHQALAFPTALTDAECITLTTL